MSPRRLTTAVTLSVLVLVLCGMAVWGFEQATKPLPTHEASAKPTCSEAETQVKEFIRRSEIQVSVYNAGKRKRLATTTLTRLESKGFRPGQAGNAPQGSKVALAEVRTTRADDAAARLVALAFGPTVKVVVTDEDLGPGVDVLVGDDFRRLDRKAPARLKLAKPIVTCIKVK